MVDAALTAGKKQGGNRSFRRSTQRMPGGRRLQILKELQVRAAIGHEFVASEVSRLNRLYDGLAGKVTDEAGGRQGGLCCSENWVDANWMEGLPYPPGNDLTLMIRCVECGALTPPQNMGSSGHCDDCRLASMSPGELERLPSSTSSVNLGRLKASRRVNGPEYKGGF